MNTSLREVENFLEEVIDYYESHYHDPQDLANIYEAIAGINDTLDTLEEDPGKHYTLVLSRLKKIFENYPDISEIEKKILELSYFSSFEEIAIRAQRINDKEHREAFQISQTYPEFERLKKEIGYPDV